MTFKKKIFLILDCNSILHRAFHALPPLSTKEGIQIGAVYGFCLVFLKLIKEFNPEFIAAAFDYPALTFRHQEFKEYKIKRPKPPKEFYPQIKITKEILKAFKVPVFEKEGFEADDIIGTIVKETERKQIFPKIENIIVSGDLDSLQLINQNTKVFLLQRGIKKSCLIDQEKVKERYDGLLPSQLEDYKSLRGDPSDNIPGVTGIGDKTAKFLIKNFGSLENLYKRLESEKKLKEINKNLREKLLSYKEQAFLSKELVKLNRNVPLNFSLKECTFWRFNMEEIEKIFKDLEFKSLIKKLKELKINKLI